MQSSFHLATAAEMRRLDLTAINEFGLPGIVLMENAAQAVFRALMDFWPHWPSEPKALIAVGPGQNGGDGWALARILSAHGFKVVVYLLRPQGLEIKGDAAVNEAVARRLGLAIKEAREEGVPLWDSFDLIVDALFGTGLNRPLDELSAGWLAEAAAAKGRLGAKLRVVAVDIPSGLSSDDGRLWGPVLPADLTVSLGAGKVGLYLGRGPDFCGQICIGDIGLTKQMFDRARPAGFLAAPATLAHFLPPRPADGHKGVFGHVLLAGGAKGKSGALSLAAQAAARSGAALVTALHPASLNDIYETKLTEVMTEPLPEEEPGQIGALAGEQMLRLSQKRQALGLGLGLGLNEGAARAVWSLIEDIQIPLVLDADALTHLAGRLDCLRHLSSVVLTPHPGEAARLLGLSSAQIQSDRLGSARKIAELSGGVVILKGRHSLIVEASGRFYLDRAGGPHLAVGGSGDLLTGLLTGLLARIPNPFHAAALAVYAHSRAAALARENMGPWGLTPGDFLNWLPAVWRELSAAASA